MKLLVELRVHEDDFFSRSWVTVYRVEGPSGIVGITVDVNPEVIG